MKNYLTLMVLLASASAFAESTNNQIANSSSEVQSPESIAEVKKEMKDDPQYMEQAKSIESTADAQVSKDIKQSVSSKLPSKNYTSGYTGGGVDSAIQGVITYGEAKQDNEEKPLN
ncbi:MAG: hypothetical protein P8L77_04765 [Gammaproteobacteria bacterium]|nr:hypothetical protein [Gammaproteobacteria bacterium]